MGAVLHGALGGDPATKPVFRNRTTQPDEWASAWQAALKRVGKAVAKLRPARVTSDNERAAAAVRNVSTEPTKRPMPSSKEVVDEMSPQEFTRYLADVAAGKFG